MSPDDEQISNQSERRLQSIILDGAAGNFASILKEIAPQRAVAADRSRELSERVDAYEDIIDSEVGDTNLIRARNLEREYGVRQLYLKFEGGNPSGTQKDRIAFAQVMDALRRGFDAITVATCGNYGAAVAGAASLAGIRSVIFIPGGYRTRRLNEILEFDAEIIRVEGDYEEAVEASRRRALDEELYDANPGGANMNLQLQGYGTIAYELYDELRDAPAVVAVPVSNGTTLAGIYRGFMSLYRRGKTSRLPRMCAGSSWRKNPIVQSFIRGLSVCEDLNPAHIRETSINEPLINWRSIDGDVALIAVRSSQGWAADASDRAMMTASRILREKEGLNVLPASTAGLVALVNSHLKQPFVNDRYVVILTGRKG